jgi:hypothetical protein
LKQESCRSCPFSLFHFYFLNRKKIAGGSPAISIFNVPRHAVCCVILNLLSQGGNLPSGPALAEAYRFALVRYSPQVKSIGSKPLCNITNTEGHDSYTTNAGPMQLPVRKNTPLSVLSKKARPSSGPQLVNNAATNGHRSVDSPISGAISITLTPRRDSIRTARGVPDRL